MPEGPEIHIEADRIRNAVGDQNCVFISFYHEHLKPFEAELTDKKILSVEAYGKGLVISFEGDAHIFSHNQLYGKWYTAKAGNYPKTSRSLRLEIQTANKSALLYSASEIDVLDDESVKQHPYLSTLGPDLLRQKDVTKLADQCLSSNFRNKKLSGLLLDQRFFAGIGNYLRSEILFFSKLSPDTKPAELSEDELKLFCEAASLITWRAYNEKGITLDDARVLEAKKQGKTRRQYRHYVFGRDGKPCYICGDTILKTKEAGRRLYSCPTCQN
ncbi:MAG: endonuclease VIII [Balneolales bacterium]|nr:endonuclease VIII [Balneolales bacterium]